ncbi:MAG: tetratricopeptide repeat protein [Bacteroides sp.]|nr:tetratricopeptide repeat protein [Bacteroides sp.]
MNGTIRKIGLLLLLLPLYVSAQINTERVMTIARNALYFEDYVLSIQYFNQVINAKPYLFEPYFFRGVAKISLEDFQGAEDDCSEAIRRNPFMVGAYQVRGLARIRQNKFDGAIEDYQMALKHAPENVVLWHNLTLCHMQKQDYEAAQEDLARLLSIAPRYTRAYLMRGEVYLRQNDTIKALNDFEQAIAMDRYDADGWSARAIVRIQQKKYKEAEQDLNQAIHLSVKNAGNYINRALVRFYQDNLRGAMSDYDLALDLDPNNFIGHYNRGLLRAQVGDDNRAIEDFDFVLEIEPDNMLATFNRGVLRAQTGDYKGAVSDYSRVIEVYPNFLAGYYQRAEARKKMGDRKGAEADEFQIMKIQIDRRNAATSKSDKTVADADDTDKADGEKTRKKSDKNVENYRKIVVDDSEVNQRYTSDYRGRVQDRNVTIKLEPMFVLSYYEKISEVKRSLHYHKYVEELNHRKIFPKTLRITNMEAPLTEKQVQFHFALIDKHTADAVADSRSAEKRFMRGLDFYLVQDFSSSIEDFTKSIVLDDTFFPAYFMRALVRCKQLEYRKAEAASIHAASGNSEGKSEVTALDYEIVKKDLDQVITLAPDFVYAYYNRGNVFSTLKDYRAALADYNKAIELAPDFAEAYFNRGLTHIFLGNNKQGIADLSKAGELGVVSAYNIIKRFIDRSE